MARPEASAFTAMDRLATGGVSFNGARWHQKADDQRCWQRVTFGGISGGHAQYLAMGGHDFLLGDGALVTRRRRSGQDVLRCEAVGASFDLPDLQHDANPAYNEARGPVWFPLHPAAHGIRQEMKPLPLRLKIIEQRVEFLSCSACRRTRA